MKIPQFQYSRVPQAQTIDTGAIAGAARAQMGISKTLVEVGTKFGEQILEAETEAEYQRVKDGVQADADQLWNDLQAEPAYDDNKNPTHNTLRKRFDEGYKKIVDKYQGNLQFHPNKANVSNVATDIGLTYGRNVDAEVRKRQVDNARGQVFTTISNIRYDDPNSITEARDAVKAAGLIGTISETEVLQAEQEIWGNEQDNIIRSGFQAARESGTAIKYADGIEYPLEFDQAMRDKYDNYMRTYIDRDAAEAERLVNKAERDARAADSAAWEKLYPTLQTLRRGDNVPDDVIEQVQQFIDTTNDPSRKFDATVAMRTNIAMTSMKGMTIDERAEAINATFVGGVDDLTSAVNANLRQAAAQMNSAIKSDPWQAFTMYGDDGVPEITFKEAMDAGDTAAYFDYIKERKAKIEEWAGINVPAFSDQDVAAVGRSGMPAVKEIITNYEPEEAFKVLELVYKTDAKEVAIAGSIMLQHDGGDVMNAYLAGEQSDTAHLPKGTDPANSKTADMVFSEIAVDVFPDDPKYRDAFKEVVASVYAGMSRGDGVFDSKLYEKAFAMAGGGLVKTDEQWILMPDRKWTAGDWDRKLRHLELDDIAGMGGFQGQIKTGTQFAPVAPAQHGQPAGIATVDVVETPQEVLDRIKNGEARFVQADGRGKYHVYINGYPVTNADNEMFTLDFSIGK
jgi:hypothetical protein